MCAKARGPAEAFGFDGEAGIMAGFWLGPIQGREDDPDLHTVSIRDRSHFQETAVARGQSRLSASACAVAYVGRNIFACGFDCSLERNLSEQFGVPVSIRRSPTELVVGDQQIRMDIIHGCGPSIEDVRGIEVMLRRGPQTPACLAKLIGSRPKIALQKLRDPRE